MRGPCHDQTDFEGRFDGNDSRRVLGEIFTERSRLVAPFLRDPGRRHGGLIQRGRRNMGSCGRSRGFGTSVFRSFVSAVRIRERICERDELVFSVRRAHFFVTHQLLGDLHRQLNLAGRSL